MLITRISAISNEKNTMDIDIDSYQLKKWQNGGLIQDVMPHLTADEREFIMTGITPAEWDATFKGLAVEDAGIVENVKYAGE